MTWKRNYIVLIGFLTSFWQSRLNKCLYVLIISIYCKSMFQCFNINRKRIPYCKYFNNLIKHLQFIYQAIFPIRRFTIQRLIAFQKPFSPKFFFNLYPPSELNKTYKVDSMFLSIFLSLYIVYGTAH